jgi:hypothetical protein
MRYHRPTARAGRTACHVILALTCVCGAARADLRTAATQDRGQRNIFFPVGRVPSGADDDADQKLDEAEFRLLGTVISGGRAGALISIPPDGDSVWLERGDNIGGLTVEEVRGDSLVLRREDDVLLLAIGKSSRQLSGQTRTLAGAFNLLGICGSDDQRFALIQLQRGGKVQRLGVDDRVGPGVVAAIYRDGIVLSHGTRKHSVPVGAAYPQQADLR